MFSHLNVSRLIKNDWGLFPFLVGLTAGIYLITLQIIDPSFLYFPGDLGDGRLNLYFLENAYRYFTGKADTFWNAPFMYPEPNVIAISDNLLGSAPIYSFFRLIGLDSFTSYQWWFVILAALNYTTAYLFLRKVFRNNYAAVLGAMIFAFSIALQSQMTHPQTFPRFAIPLAFLMAVKFREKLDPRYFFLTVLFVVYQIYCGIYLGFMLMIPVTLLLVMFIWKHPSRSSGLINRRWWLRMLAGFGVNAILLLPLMLPYAQRNIAPTLNHYREILSTVPTLKSHFYSQKGSLLWDFLSETATHYDAFWDHQLFAGGLATLSILIFTGMQLYRFYKEGFGFPKSRLPLYLFLAGAISWILYLRIGRVSAYFLVYVLPGFSAMRSITRIINIELIFFAIATAFVFSAILKKDNWRTYLLFLFFASVMITDNYFKEGKAYRTEKRIAFERMEPLMNLVKTFPEGSVISYEPREPESMVFNYHLDAMLVSQACNLATINGYSASCPHEFAKFWNNIDEASRNHWLSFSGKVFDTLYVIHTPEEYEKVPWSEIEAFEIQETSAGPTWEERLKDQMDYIRSDTQWMKHIQEKAIENELPVDSMLKLDAIWVLEYENNDPNP
jgi:hypothetical protein